MCVYPVWAEIDLSAIAHNVKEVRRITQPAAQILAVVKANGYGHGAVEVSRVALANGASWLGVARITEAAALRKAGIIAPVLVLGYTPPEQGDEVVRNRLSQAVYSRDMALALSASAAKRKTKAKIHIKIDTGMGRIGIWSGSGAVSEIINIARTPNLEIEGVFTHFANADGDTTYTRLQLERFLDTVEALRREGLEIPYRHAANSPALMDMPETHLDMVRAGIIIYGLSPADNMRHSGGTIIYGSSPAHSGKQNRMLLKPAMSLKAKVAYVKRVPAGFNVSYGCTYTTTTTTTIATLPLGYADGYPRSLSVNGEVLIKGRRLPVIGRVCMDQVMVDAGNDLDIVMGDQAVLLGSQGSAEITASEIAAKLNTINYEVVSMINWRVPRLYV